MRLIDADHLRRWILSRVFKTQLSVADIIDQIDREDTIEPDPDTVSRQQAIDAVEFGITHAKAINKETGEVVELFRASNNELRKAVDRIKQLPPSPTPCRPQWVPCSERLPEKPENYPNCEIRRIYYLVSLESGCVKALAYEFDRDEWQHTGSPVVAWMPLPEPYKGAEHDR